MAKKKRIINGKGNEVLTIKVKDFTKDKDEPAYDVEFYINGQFDNTYDGVISTKDIGKLIAYEKALYHAYNKLFKMLNSK